jgi:CheY-like chemotaxis protein
MISNEINSLIEKNKIKVLVVEDNLLNQKLAGFILKDLGLKYDISSNGQLALENIKLNTYDLILMDIQMPLLNGYETTDYIRKSLKLELPIIAMTAHAMQGEKEKCLSAGMTDYISKPINETDLINLIAKYLFLRNNKSE